MPGVENRVGNNVGIFLWPIQPIQPFYSFTHSFTHVALGTVVETQKNKGCKPRGAHLKERIEHMAVAQFQ